MSRLAGASADKTTRASRKSDTDMRSTGLRMRSGGPRKPPSVSGHATMTVVHLAYALGNNSASARTKRALPFQMPGESMYEIE